MSQIARGWFGNPRVIACSGSRLVEILALGTNISTPRIGCGARLLTSPVLANP